MTMTMTTTTTTTTTAKTPSSSGTEPASTSAAEGAAATLAELLGRDGATIAQLAAHLDGLTHEARVEECFALSRKQQRRLYQLAASAPPLGFDHFVPAHVADATEVRHIGRNTLPLTPRHRRFEKRFCRPADGSARLYGYNQAPSTRLVGPGYFVAIETAGTELWMPRGAIVVDYFQVPDADARLPEHWPALRHNGQGLQRLVYKGTRDYMRGVSAHVSIGAAFKGEKALDHYFVLVRKDD